MADAIELSYPRVGDTVIYHDEHGKPHNALLTCVHGWETEGIPVIDQMPCVNLLYVSSDEKRQDDYGRQVERDSSCVHKTMNGGVHGGYWRNAHEEPNTYTVPQR